MSKIENITSQLIQVEILLELFSWRNSEFEKIHRQFEVEFSNLINSIDEFINCEWRTTKGLLPGVDVEKFKDVIFYPWLNKQVQKCCEDAQNSFELILKEKRHSILHMDKIDLKENLAQLKKGFISNISGIDGIRFETLPNSFFAIYCKNKLPAEIVRLLNNYFRDGYLAATGLNQLEEMLRLFIFGKCNEPSSFCILNSLLEVFLQSAEKKIEQEFHAPVI